MPQLLLVVVGRLQRIWEAEEVKVEQTLEVSAAQADRNQSVCDQNGSVQARVDLVRPRKEKTHIETRHDFLIAFHGSTVKPRAVHLGLHMAIGDGRRGVMHIHAQHMVEGVPMVTCVRKLTSLPKTG